MKKTVNSTNSMNAKRTRKASLFGTLMFSLLAFTPFAQSLMNRWERFHRQQASLRMKRTMDLTMTFSQ
jgi:hypothetical protein